MTRTHHGLTKVYYSVIELPNLYRDDKIHIEYWLDYKEAQKDEKI